MTPTPKLRYALLTTEAATEKLREALPEQADRDADWVAAWVVALRERGVYIVAEEWRY